MGRQASVDALSAADHAAEVKLDLDAIRSTISSATRSAAAKRDAHKLRTRERRALIRIFKKLAVIASEEEAAAAVEVGAELNVTESCCAGICRRQRACAAASRTRTCMPISLARRRALQHRP